MSTTSFVIGASELAEITAWVARILDARPLSPALGGLLFEAEADADTEGRLTVRGYDGDTALVATVDAAVESPGSLLVSGRLMNAIASTLAGGRKPAQIKVSGTKDRPFESTTAKVTSGRSEWEMPLMNTSEYPPLPRLDAAIGVLDAAALNAALARVLPAVGRDPSTPSLSAVKLEGDAAELTMAATDRYRIASITLPWTPKVEIVEGTVDELLPADLLEPTMRAFGAGDQVALHVGGTVGFTTDTRSVIGRPLAGGFPPWRSRMKADPAHYVTLDTEELLWTVNQANALGESHITLHLDGDEIEVSARGDIGTARALAPVAELVGEPLTLTVNAQYLREGLTACGSPQVTVHLGANAHRPVMLLPVGDAAFQYLTIPLRVGQ